MAMTEDFTAFMNPADFASQVTLAGVPVVGIFDAEYLLVDLGSGIESSGPALTLPSANVPASVGGVAVLVNGKTYKVVESKPDGTGITVLRLRVGA